MKKSMLMFLKLISPLIIALVFFVSVSDCQSQEGIMEKAGKKIGEAVEAPKDTAVKAEEKTGMDKVEEGKSKIEEGMGKVKEGMDMGK